MHKSGTTLVSQILHHSGINMGGHVANGISYDQGNQYERECTWRLNEEILQAQDVRSIYINTPERLRLSTEQQARMRRIISECSQAYAHWGFKDPRTCLVYPLWATELPEHKLIIIYRDPTEPWPRYRPRHIRNRYREPYLAWKYLQSWCEHNLNILTYLRQTAQPYIVLEYKRLVTTQEEFDRLQNFLDLPLTDRRKPSLYRNHSQKYQMLSLAGWLLGKQKGYQPQTLWQQLEAYRQ
jgi:hypothetical protein